VSTKYILSLLLAALLIAGAVRTSTAQTPVAIEQGQTQIFLDDFIVGNSGLANVSRKAHAAQKRATPVITPENPWEAARTYVYGSVYYDAQSDQYEMWYMSRLHNEFATKQRDPALNRAGADLVLYATSDDGINWQKPNLGLYSYDNSTANNIVFDLHSPSVYVDPDVNATERYKMMGTNVRTYGSAQYGYNGAVSDDGKNWTDMHSTVAFGGSDTISLMRDPHSGTYFAYHKQKVQVGTNNERRAVYVSTSDDFETWTPPTAVFLPTQAEDIAGPGIRTDFYNMTAFPYAGQYIGLLGVFNITQDIAHTQPNQSSVDGPVSSQIVHSRDAITWERFEDRTAVIAPDGLGDTSDFDDGLILGVSNPIVTDEEIRVYYTGMTTEHGGTMPPKTASIGLATWRLDGFASLHADGVGTATTNLLDLPDGKLVVNVDAVGGSLRASLVDEHGAAIAGYGLDDSIPITSDELDAVVQWQGRSMLPSDVDASIVFYLEDADLYSFSVQHAPEPTSGLLALMAVVGALLPRQRSRRTD
jgi:hypothetical protein